MAKKIPQPKKPERYGKAPTFTEPNPPAEPNSCKTCGAVPPCRPHKN